MKAEINVKKEFDLKLLVVKADVRYWEDAIVNGTEDEEGNLVPCRDGDLWSPHIEIESGKILNWVQGTTAKIHYKVCDGCGWELQDENGEVVLSVTDGYVPSTLYPKESGYGDYIIMDIDENGIIADWEFEINDFTEEE